MMNEWIPPRPAASNVPALVVCSLRSLLVIPYQESSATLSSAAPSTSQQPQRASPDAESCYFLPGRGFATILHITACGERSYERYLRLGGPIEHSRRNPQGTRPHRL